jgi:hypothetical protein
MNVRYHSSGFSISPERIEKGKEKISRNPRCIFGIISDDYLSENKSYLTETIKILIIFDRSFFTESIVVIRIILPIRPKTINTNASTAPMKVACRVGCLN